MLKRDFRAALATIPHTTPYVVRGRDPRQGLDCIGLILAVYKAAGINIDELDVPYGSRDQHRLDKLPLMVHRLQLRFKEMDRTVPQDCNDGDVLVIGKSGDNHLGIAVRDLVIEMTGQGIKFHNRVNVWPFVTMVFRHHACMKQSAIA